MKKHATRVLAGALVLGLNAAPVHAFHCPLLVKECLALVAKMDRRADTNKKKLAKAKQGCEEALSRHEAGQHKPAVLTAGKAIIRAGKAVNPSLSATGNGSGGGDGGY